MSFPITALPHLAEIRSMFLTRLPNVDRPLAVAIVVWAALSVAVLYFHLRLFGE